MEYDRQKKQEKLNTATKQLKNTIVKENMKEFRLMQEKEAIRRNKEYGKVLFEVPPRHRDDQIRRLEQKRIR